MRTVTASGSWGSAGDTCQPARSIARSTTGSRALPASIAVSDSSLGGFVGWYPVAEYQRARRQLPTDDARISSCPSSSKRALGAGEDLRQVDVCGHVDSSCFLYMERRGRPRRERPRLDSRLSIVLAAHAAAFTSAVLHHLPLLPGPEMGP